MADFSNQGLWAGLDPQRREAFARAVSESTAGSELTQNLTNRIVQQLSLRHYGLLGVLDTRPGQGQQAVVNRRATSAAGTWAQDTATIAETSGTYTQETFTYRSLLAQAQVTRKIRATGRSYIDILAEEMTKRLEDFNQRLDSGLLRGDPSGYFVGGTSVETFSTEGFMSACNTYDSGSQVINNGAALAGAGSTTIGTTLTLKNLDTAIDLIKGSANRNDMIMTSSYAGLRAINAALTSRQIFNDTVEIAAGFRVRTYDGIPIIPDTNMTDTFSYVTDGMAGDSVLLTETGGTSTNILIMNTRLNWIEELTPTTVMPLARDTSQYEAFDIFWDGAAVVGNPLGSSLVIGIITT
jgi:hypothetical protein